MSDIEEAGSQPAPGQPAPGQPAFGARPSGPGDQSSPPPGYGPPPAYGQAPGYDPPPPGYGPPGAYGQHPAYGQPPGYGQAPGYGPPPPGYGPPPAYGQAPGYDPPPPGYDQPGAYGQHPAYGQPPGYGPGWAAAPAPGGVPLRPLALGDIYSGAVNLARRNPGSTFGLTAIMATTYGILYALLQVIARKVTPGDIAWIALVSYPVSYLIQFITTGMLTTVIGRGVLGRKIGIGEAWRTARVASVIGAALLLLIVDIAPIVVVVVLVVLLAVAHAGGAAVAVGLIGGVGALVTFILAAVRLSLTMPGVVLERLGALTAMRRSWRLSRGSFWRLFGIKLLTLIIITIASFIIQLPFTLGAGAGAALINRTTAPTGIAYVLVTAVGGIVALTLMQPLKSGTTVLLYLDLRMRREGLDLALRNAAQSQQLTGDEFATVWQPPAPGQWQPQGAGQWQPQAQWPAQGPPAAG